MVLLLTELSLKACEAKSPVLKELKSPPLIERMGVSMTNDELTQAIKSSPREIMTARTTLRIASLDMLETRLEWVQASTDTLDYLPGWRDNFDPEVAKRSIERDVRCVENGEDVVYNVFETSTSHYVGRIDLHTWDSDAPRCEIGYMADSRTSGKGLLREAALACVELAFNMGAARIQAVTDTRNLRSIAFAKSIGMQEEGVLRNYERLNGVLCDQQLLSICRG
jgi:RimJ/RimL family protein N-acetyltransferase